MPETATNARLLVELQGVPTMGVQVLPGSGSATRSTLAILQEIFRDYHPRDFAVRLWDGTAWESEPGQPLRFTLVLKHPGSLRGMLLPGTELALGEAFIYDDFDVEGEIEAVFRLGDFVLGHHLGLIERLGLARNLFSLPDTRGPRDGRHAASLSGRQHSIERDRAAVTYHYDVSNDFYATFLDRKMVYSCAYFASPDEDLDSAQARKLDYICRKLRLEPGQRLLDIGCGWGGLIMHAAREYGVEALGITLSRPQADYANARIRESGLADRCRVEVLDYREVPLDEHYDRLVSVGMFEHVGQAKLAEYLGRSWRLLKPGGAFLNHGIAVNANSQPATGPTFNDSYVFPDGELVPISATLTTAELCGFEVRDVESLREHYMYTLRRWVSNLEARHEAAVAATDEVTYRVWRLFLGGSAHGFRLGRINVYQSLLVKPDADGRSGLPLTRADWYASPSG
jgi:cyclopropane-fatty-acyl-phospholipid synthase